MVNNFLAAADVFRTIGSILLAVLILLVMITVHEFGHYLAGKIFKFKINEFSIGFGPALFKKTNKKTGELFSVRLIPLGGYCAFEGEDGVEEEKDEEGNVIKKEPHPQSFTMKKPWQRIIVLVSGALMNYLLALLLIIVHFFAYGQTMVAVYEAEGPTEGIAQEYCLQDKDILLEANGRSLYLTTDVARALKGKSEGDLVEFRISRVVGQSEGENVREEMTVKVMLRFDPSVENSAQLDGAWKALGVKYSEGEDYTGYMLASASYRFGFFETLGRSFLYSFKIAGAIFGILGELLTGALGLSALGGPVSTIKMTSQIAAQGLRSFLDIASYIGVNLAVFNLLPIPALDGSKVVFTAIEGIFKKPVNRKVEAVIHAVGFVLLFGFAILVDLLQLFG